MTELLAIFGPTDADSALITEIERLRPRRVTVLLEGAHPGWAEDDGPAGVALRERMAALLALIERRTGAAVEAVGGDPDQLAGRRFDRTVALRQPIAA
jgi:hypothetical protein